MRKALQQHISLWQICMVLFASTLGMVCLGLPMMLFKDASQLVQHEHRLFDDAFLVLNKRVTMFNTIGLGSVGFNPQEIDSLSHIKGIQKVGTFDHNAFQIWAEADFGGANVVRTELFLEGVDDEFIDQPPAGWFWSEGQSEVPIMVPTDYLALYNFGFAPGQNLPGISKDLAKQSKFTLYVSGQGKQMQFEGRIAGFSDRIETILAPKSFLQWANQYFASESKQRPKRVIVKANESIALQQEMSARGYETNKEKLQSVRFQQLVRQVMGAAYGLGICMVLLAIGSFILFSNLLITRSRERIQTLFLLGYSRKKLAYLMARKVLIFPIVSLLVALPVAAWLRWNIIQDVRVFIGEVSAWPSVSAILGMLCLLAVYLTVAVLDLWRQLTRIERPH